MRNYSLSHKKKSYVFSPEQNHATNSEKKVTFTLTKDESFYFIAAHWVDLHGLLYNALPSNVFLWGHLFLSFHFADDKGPVIVKAKVLETNKVVGIVGDLLVAADGCCAWRGVLEFSNVENSKTITGIRKVYPDDKGPVIVKAKVLETNKVVGIVGDLLVAADDIQAVVHGEGFLSFQMLRIQKPSLASERYSGCCAWRGVLEFSNVENSKTITGIIKVYPDLEKCLYFDLASSTHTVLYELQNKKPEPKVKVNVVLVGDVAHPTTPHCFRNTNMSILDAAVLGKCIEKWVAEKLESALEEYQFIRLPVTSKQVLHARHLGRGETRD
ncbi:hypothetical protein JHK87_039597 [Glycine soja]|nr:hypothetical protein JHK87_039597 [Glycine soja]